MKDKSNVRKVTDALRGQIVQEALLAAGHMLANFAKLNIRSTFSSRSTGGTGLAGSMTVIVGGAGVKSYADVGPTKVYGRIQELGGTIKPLHAKVLAWIGDDGQMHFAKRVTLPPRPYLRPALDNHADDITTLIKTLIAKGISDACD